MTKETNLPTAPPDGSDMPVIFKPPTSWEVADRGAAETINLTTVGDWMVGIFEGLDEITTDDGEHLIVARFLAPSGRPVALFPNSILKRSLVRVEVGRWVRITLEKLVDVGKPSPLKSFVVEVAPQ